MANSVKAVNYYYVELADRPGSGLQILNALKDARVNLLAINGFPSGANRTQLDMVPANEQAFLKAASDAKLKLVGPKRAFLVQGSNQAGALAEVLQKLADARINLTAAQAIAANPRSYGAIIWVKPRQVSQAARVLGAE